MAITASLKFQDKAFFDHSSIYCSYCSLNYGSNYGSMLGSNRAQTTAPNKAQTTAPNKAQTTAPNKGSTTAQHLYVISKCFMQVKPKSVDQVL